MTIREFLVWLISGHWCVAEELTLAPAPDGSLMEVEHCECGRLRPVEHKEVGWRMPVNDRET